MRTATALLPSSLRIICLMKSEPSLRESKYGRRDRVKAWTFHTDKGEKRGCRSDTVVAEALGSLEESEAGISPKTGAPAIPMSSTAFGVTFSTKSRVEAADSDDEEIEDRRCLLREEVGITGAKSGVDIAGLLDKLELGKGIASSSRPLLTFSRWPI